MAAFSCGKMTTQIEGAFTHGVASGDPDHTSVVLWTRYVPGDSTIAEVKWTVAEDARMRRVVATGNAQSVAENDYCVKVIAEALHPNETYYYQFTAEETHSSVGRTRTLPTRTEHIRIGVVNCAKYTGGFYHAYEALAQMDDIDVVIHLGDYIYENGPTKAGDSYYEALLGTGRQHEPPHECLSLQDYRIRYAQYHSDTSLIKLHERFPMIPIWDDHEIAMKQLKKLPNGELQYGGDWQGRLQNSLKAYHEWLPLRPIMGEVIYRSFQFGDLVNLLMLDTRVCCKSEVPKTQESLRDTSRHIVGTRQLNWIEEDILRHGATWNVFGNQLLMARKDQDWERWPGFPADRDRLIRFIEQNDHLNYLVTTGNAHNPHHYVVLDDARRDTVVHEFLPGAISSGNKAEKSFNDPEGLRKWERKLDEADNVLWYEPDAHGFIVIDLRRDRAVGEWYFVSNIRNRDPYELSKPYEATVWAKEMAL